MRDKRRFRQRQGWLLLWFFYFPPLGGGPSPLPASGWLTGSSFRAAGNLTVSNRQQEISVFLAGAPSAVGSLADAVLPLAVPRARGGPVGFEVPVAGGEDGGRGGRLRGLSLLQRPVPQVLEGERNANVAHGELGARQLEELRGPVGAARGPALAEDKEGVLHQDLHAHLQDRKQEKTH